MHVLVIGNPFDGMTLVGPFEDSAEALEYADRENATEYHVVTIHAPED